MTPFRSAPPDASPCPRCGTPRADLLDANGNVVCAACAATGEANARFDAGRRSARRAAELGKLLAVVGIVLGAGITLFAMLFGLLVFVDVHGDDLFGLRIATILLLSVGVVAVTVCIRKLRRLHPGKRSAGQG